MDNKCLKPVKKMAEICAIQSNKVNILCRSFRCHEVIAFPQVNYFCLKSFVMFKNAPSYICQIRSQILYNIVVNAVKASYKK